MNRYGESGKRTAGYRSPGETGPENGYRKRYCSAITKNVTVQPLHLLVFIFMKTRSLVVPPYADLDEKVLMQASLQHTFSFKPAHG